MQAAWQQCELGRMFWFNNSPEGALFAVADDGGWWHGPDEDHPNQTGFDWARANVPGVLDLVGNPTLKEEGYQGDCQRLDNGWRFQDVSGTWIELEEGGLDEPALPPEAEPPEAETPPVPAPPPSPPLWFSQEPRSWHLVPLPGDFVFNLAWCYWVNKRSDGTCRARLIYPCDDTEPLPEGISFAGDRVMVFAGEMAARLWAHIQEVIARQFD
jgi:hypothetical protein